MIFELHPRLVAATLPIGDLALCRVLLQEERRMPWLMLVPRRPEIGSMIELSRADRAQFMDELALAGVILQKLFQPIRLNIADIGNLCPQLHVHLVARFADDPFWPKVAWSRMPYERYQDDDGAERARQIAGAFQAASPFTSFW